MTSSTIGPGVLRFRDLLDRGEEVDVAAITLEYPEEALALADKVRHAIARDCATRKCRPPECHAARRSYS